MFLRYGALFSVVVTIALLASCGNDKADEILPFDDSTCIESGHIVNYSEDIKPILETHCTLESLGACHQPAGNGGTYGLDYTTYAAIKLEVDNGQLEARVFDLMDMPSPIATPPQTLSECDYLLIQTWIDNGAPEN